MDALLDFIRTDLGTPGLATLLTNPRFAFIQLMNSISMGMNLFIIAAGLSLIFGVLKVINFAHGAFYMFGAYIIFTVSQQWELNFWLGVVAAAVGLALLSVVIEQGLFRHVYDKEHLMQLLLTFAVVLILGDLAKIIWGTDQYSVSYPPGLDGATDLGITRYPSYRLVLCLIGPLIAIGLWLFIERTRWGRMTRAATQDREMLAALGINVPVIYAGVFILGSALAGGRRGAGRAVQQSDAGHGCDGDRRLLRHRHHRRPGQPVGQLRRRADLWPGVQLRLRDRTQLAGRVRLPAAAGRPPGAALGPVRPAGSGSALKPCRGP